MLRSKGLLWSLVTLFLLATVLSACNSGNSGEAETTENETPAATSSTETPAAKPEPEPAGPVEISTLFVVDGNLIVEDTADRDAFLLERFNLIFTGDEVITQLENDQKLRVMFASGDYPDLLFTVNNEKSVKEWGNAGFLKPLNAYLDRMPNYRNSFTDDAWEVMMKTATTADGNLYYFPGPNWRTYNNTWNYNKTVFDELGLAFPQTTEQFYDALVKIKQAYPESYPLGNRYEDVFGPFYGVMDGFRIPSLAATTFWKDPDADNALLFGGASDKFRDFLIYATRLYKDNLVAPDYMTVTSDIFWQRVAGNQTIVTYYGAGNVPTFTNRVKENFPNMEWAYHFGHIAAYDQPGFQFRDREFFTFGPVITNNVTEEEMDVLVEFLDWTATTEGQRWAPVREGKQYNLDENGLPVNVEGAVAPVVQGLDGLKVPDVEALKKRLPVFWEQDEIKKDDPYPERMYFTYTVEEESELATIMTQLSDTVTQFAAQVITGQADVSRDDIWNGYLNSLQQVGLERAQAIHLAAVDRK